MSDAEEFDAATRRPAPPGYQVFEPERQPPPGFRRLRPKGMVCLGDNEPLHFQPEVIRDTLPKEGFGFIGGQSGALKTFAALELAKCINTGMPFAGRKIERTGGVVYIAAEGAGTLPARIKALRSTLPDPDVRLPLYGLDDVCPLNGKDAFAKLEERLYQMNRHMAAEHDVPLVAFIIDTVSAANMIGEDKENDPAAWQKGVFDPLQKISRNVNAVGIGLHHFGKSASAGLRGTSNIRAGADFVLALTCDRDELTGKSSNHFLALSKSRTAPEGPIGPVTPEQVLIGHREDGSDVHSLILHFDAGQRKRVGNGLSGTNRLALAALAEVILRHDRTISGVNIPHSVKGATLEEWREECEARSITDSDKADSRSKAFRRAKKELLLAQRIGIQGEFVWLAS